MKTYTLKELRIKNNMTLEEAGAQLGLSRQAVEQFEKRRSMPKLQTIKKILKLYKVKFEQIDWQDE